MKELPKYLDKRTGEIIAILALKPGRYNVESFHKLRVAIKKLRFVSELIKSKNKNFKEKKSIRPINVIFEKAGKVRDAHVEIIVLKNYARTEMFRNFKLNLDEKILSGKIKFFESLGKTPKTDYQVAFRKLHDYSKTISIKDVTEYYRKHFDFVRRHLKKKGQSDKDLHEIRKQLKKISYAENVLSETQNKNKNLKPLADLLGKWHDNVVIMDHLKKASKSKKCRKSESVFLEKIILVLIDKNEKFLKLLEKKTKVLL